MTVGELERCKCGEPKNDKGLCGHCDTAIVKPHDPKICQRCSTISQWYPWKDYEKGAQE